MKKVISILLSVLMLCSVTTGLNLTVYAAETTTTGERGENVTFSFYSSTGTLTISGTGQIRNWAFNNYDNVEYSIENKLKTVIIEEGVTSMPTPHKDVLM